MSPTGSVMLYKPHCQPYARWAPVQAVQAKCPYPADNSMPFLQSADQAKT